MLRTLLPALFWALIILFLSAHPQMGLPESWWGIQPDKIGHATAYAVLAFFLQYGFSKSYWPVILGTGYGICIEFLQHAFFYGRQFDVWDMLANFVGCSIGVLVFPYCSSLFRFGRK